MKPTTHWIRLLALLLLAVFGSVVVAAQTTQPTNIAIILDASGSMQALFSDGQTRIAIAKDAVIDLANELPPAYNASLWAYGHRLPQDDPVASCIDIEQIIPLAPVDAAQFEQVVTPLNAIGYTPIAESLQLAVTGMPADSENIVVLMSDGEESCGGDPCAVAAELISLGFEVVINTIGVAPDANTRAQLQCIAQASGGAYYEANDAGSLTEALAEASAPPAPETGFIEIVTPHGELASQIGFEVLNPADSTSLGSRLGSGEFPPGEYTVRVNISPVLETTAIVTADETTVITLPETGVVRLVDGEGNVTDVFPFTLYDPETEAAVAYSSGGLAEIPAGDYRAVVNSNPPLEQPVTVAAGETVDIVLSIGAIQTVTEDGEPIANYYFYVTNAETGELVTGGMGQATVAPGIYDVEVYTTPHTFAQVTVNAGETVDIPIGDVGTIRIVTEDGETTNEYAAYVYNAETGEYVTGVPGQIEIAPGVYDVEIYTTPHTFAQVTVNVGETVDIPVGGVGTIQTVTGDGEITDEYAFYISDAETGESISGGFGQVEIAPGVYEVEVYTTPHTLVEVIVEVGETVDIVIGGMGNLQTVTEDGEPTDEYYYYVYDAETGEFVSGGIGLTEIAPGVYDVEINTTPVTEVQVTIMAGETTDMIVGTAGSLQTLTSEGELDADYYYYVYDAETGELVTGGVGLTEVAPGVYDVDISTLPPTEMQVTVTAGETTDMVLPPIGTLEVLGAGGAPTSDYVYIYNTEEELITGGVGGDFLLVEGNYRVQYPNNIIVKVVVVANQTVQTRPDR